MPRRGEDADTSGEGTSWIVLRHTPAEGLGLLANGLRDYGVHHRVLDVPRGDALPKDIRGVGGVIVLGGPVALCASERHPCLQAETAFVEEMIAAGRPALGVCLGAQLIAQILGARVFPGEHREVGWAPVELTEDGRDDPLLVGLGDMLTVFHLHGDTYELPPDATHLARSERYEQQAFRWGDAACGFEFHLEFTEAIISRLVNEPEPHRYITEAGVDPKELLAKTAGHVAELADVAHEVFGRYFGQCGL